MPGAGAELPDTRTNTTAERRTWFADSEGVLALGDGRQLYTNKKGRLSVEFPGTSSNEDPARRVMASSIGADGVLHLVGGEQVYIDPKAWAHTAKEGDETNTDQARRQWFSSAVSEIQPPQPLVMRRRAQAKAGVYFSADKVQKAALAATHDPVAVLDSHTAGVLAAMKGFRVRRRVKYWEGVQGLECCLGSCFEKGNTYDIIDHKGKGHVFTAIEVSSFLERCCCAPLHAVQLDFKLINDGERQWATRKEIAAMPTVMTLERGGGCAKPALACCAFSQPCAEGMRMHAGAPAASGPVIHPADTTFAYAAQPLCGGCFTPSLNIFTAGGGGGFEPFAKVEGPMCFGGCRSCGWDERFGLSHMADSQLNSGIGTHDLAKIRKADPRTSGVHSTVKRKAFSDAMGFELKLAGDVAALTPQQRAAMLGAVLLADYAFFEFDLGICMPEGCCCHVSCCQIYCLGCVWPIHCKCISCGIGGGGSGDWSESGVYDSDHSSIISSSDRYE